MQTDAYIDEFGLDEQSRPEKEARVLKGSRELQPEDICFGDDIIEMDGHLLNFYMECWFNVDEVFGTHVETFDNDDYINVYADYDMVRGAVRDALSITCWTGDNREECEYRLSDAEKAILLPKMDAYCKERMGMSLAEYSAMRIAEDREALPSQSEQPEKIAAKKRREER